MCASPRGPGRSLLLVARASAIVASIALGGCGRKASPRPPQFVIPESPAPVRVTAKPEGLEVTWRRPRQYADKTDLEDLGSFDVFRSCGEADAWVPIATLPVTDRERFRKGKTFSYIDRAVPAEGPCRYRVVAVTLDDYRSAPAEGGLGDPEPTPEPTLTPAPSPTGRSETGDLERQEPAGEDSDLRVPAPLVSPTPFPAAPW